MVRTAFGTTLERVALTGVEEGHDFPVVWVTTNEDWAAARAEGREPEALPLARHRRPASGARRRHARLGRGQRLLVGYVPPTALKPRKSSPQEERRWRLGG